MRRARTLATRWLAFLLPFLLSPVASALPPINDNGSAAAVSGYDVVAYFEDGSARRPYPLQARCSQSSIDVSRFEVCPSLCLRIRRWVVEKKSL